MRLGLVLASAEEFNAIIEDEDEDPIPIKVRTSAAGVSIFGATGKHACQQRFVCDRVAVMWPDIIGVVSTDCRLASILSGQLHTWVEGWRRYDIASGATSPNNARRRSERTTDAISRLIARWFRRRRRSRS